MDVENHMVIGNDHNIEDSRAAVEADRELNERIAETKEKLLNNEKLSIGHYGSAHVVYDFDDVLVRVFEHDGIVHGEHPDFSDCCREIMQKYPASKLAKLIDYMAIAVASEILESRNV